MYLHLRKGKLTTANNKTGKIPICKRSDLWKMRDEVLATLVKYFELLVKIEKSLEIPKSEAT